MIIKRPLISEKSMLLKEVGFYTFEVDTNASKSLIARTIEEQFSVEVTSIRTLKTRRKTHQQRTRKGYFTTPGIKKAIVTLKKGQKLALFETAEEDNPEVTITRGEGEPIVVSKEKKSLLKGTKVKVEKMKVDKKKEDK